MVTELASTEPRRQVVKKGLENGVRGLLGEDEENDRPDYTVVKDAIGGERYVYDEIDPAYDSDGTDAAEQTNTIGNMPLSYESYPHTGYDINGKKIMRPARVRLWMLSWTALKYPKDGPG